MDILWLIHVDSNVWGPCLLNPGSECGQKKENTIYFYEGIPMIEPSQK